jgi:hypothetical protein
MQVDCAFPGGNIILEGIAGDTICVRQDLRDTDGDWFYFHFRVLGAAGRRLRVEFTTSKILGPLGPAVSFDDGTTWDWLGADALDGLAAFTCAVPAGADNIRFAFAVPYTGEDLAKFLVQHRGDPRLHRETLCASRKGREVELLRLGNQRAPSPRIILTCRHHACEMVGNFAIEGVIAAALTDDALGRWLRENSEIVIVPFVDKDGVEDGDQGKNRKPYDHNSDYQEPHIYPEPRALRALVAELADGRPTVVLDLHCPSIRGDQNTNIFFSGARGTWNEVGAFGRLFNQVARGPLRINESFNVAFGEKWNVDHPKLLYKHWASELPGVKVCSALEIPYAVAGGQVMLPENARAFGKDLASTARAYLG